MPSEQLDALFEELMDELWRQDPILATEVGVHAYDHLLPSIDKDSRISQRRALERYHGRLGQFKEDKGLTKDQKIDLKLVLNMLETHFYEEDKLNHPERSPTFLPNQAMGSVFLFMIREFAPLRMRLEHMLFRLQKMPRMVEGAKANMRLGGESIPRLWVDMAAEQIESGEVLFTKAIPVYAGQVPDIATDISEQAVRAWESLSGYKQFLIDEIASKANGSFAAGREVFDHMLKHRYMLPYDAAELKQIGERIIAETKRDLDSVATSIDGTRKWFEIAETLKGNHPLAEKIKDWYAEESAKLRKFIVENKIADVPEGETISIIDTPPFLCSTIPYAAYMQPAPFEKAQVGSFYVTPIDTDLPPKEQDEQLEGHNRFKAVLTAIHEGYPGHHLQLVCANRVPSKVRRLFGDTVFVEGWALYCEEMMRERGYLTDQRSALFQLKAQLLRACRVVIDVGLHTGGMTFDQAVDMLVNVARLERVSATAEVKRYTESPTQPMSYTMGKLLIKELRDEYHKKMGPDYRLKDFHNKLLSYGSLPLKILRDEILSP